MHVSLLEHQLIYCTRRISRIKTRGVHKIIKFCSFKNYTVDAYKTALKKITFLNYEYSDFSQKTMAVIDNARSNESKEISKPGLMKKY